MDAYLDIETTGLSPRYHKVTVVGISVRGGGEVVQLVGGDVTAGALLQALGGADAIYTYNGSGFDLPFLDITLGIDLRHSFVHHDLMLDCWRNNLYGGLKSVEHQLGIPRQLKDVDGAEAVRLWMRYEMYQDVAALHTLLAYNAEDVLNLKVLRRRLEAYRP